LKKCDDILFPAALPLFGFRVVYPELVEGSLTSTFSNAIVQKKFHVTTQRCNEENSLRRCAVARNKKDDRKLCS